MDYKKRIIKELEHILPAGNDQSRIFEDWLSLSLSCLEALPAHAKSVVSKKEMAEDTEETNKLFEEMRARYKPEYFVFFSKALSVLMEAADATWEDVIGDCYMEWGVPNKYSGQFFTPYHLASAMAQMTVDPDEPTRRLCAAYRQTPQGKMHFMMCESEERIEAFVKENPEAILPLCAELVERVTVNDPACGSGVMLLAAAECFPKWALDWGLVEFSGQDIDQTCVQMARINMLLHGLNGFALKLEVALLEGQAEPPTETL